MRNRIIRVAAIGLLLAGVAASSATAKHTAKKTSHLLVGINDEAFSLYGNPAAAFDTLRSLRTRFASRERHCQADCTLITIQSDLHPITKCCA